MEECHPFLVGARLKLVGGWSAWRMEGVRNVLINPARGIVGSDGLRSQGSRVQIPGLDSYF